MNSPKPNIQKTAIWFTVALLATSWGLLFKSHALSDQIEQLQTKIDSTKRSTAEINETLPSLRKTAEEFLSRTTYELVPQSKRDKWCSNLLPLKQRDVESTFQILKQKIPLGMPLSRRLRQMDSHVHPGIIPFQLQVKVSGTADQICAFLTGIDWKTPNMTITAMDLNATDSADMYTGNVIMTFPTIYYPEDLQQIQRFIQMDDS